MKWISLFFMYHLSLVIVSAGQEISRHEADSMLIKLKTTKSQPDRLELMLDMAQFHISKPGQNKTDLDSAAVYVDEAKVLIKAINTTDAEGYLLLTESSLVKERGEKARSSVFTSAEGQKMAERAIEILESGTNKDYLGKAYYELSTYYDYYDTLQSLKKIDLLQQSVNAFQQAGDLKGKGISLETLADLYYLWVGEDKSIRTLNEALAAFNSINYQKLQGIYVLFGRLYYHRYDYVSGLSYLLKALKAAQVTNDSSLKLCQINNYISSIYFDIDRLDLSVKYLKDALQIARKYDDNDAIFFVSGGLAFVYNRLGQWDQALELLNDLPKNSRLFEDPAEKTTVNTSYLQAYLGLKQLDKARPYCDSIVNITDNKMANRVYNRKAMMYMYAADFYFLSDQHGKARYYLAKSNLLATQAKDDYVQVHNAELLYKMDSAEGNFQSAYYHLAQFKEKADAFSSERKVRQFQVMSVEYEVGLKEDSIKLKDQDITLLQSKNHLQQANLKRASLIRNITVAGIILAFIIIGLLYRQYRHKQKSNQQLEAKQKEIDQKNISLETLLKDKDALIADKDALLNEKDWLVKEIHHRVKNNLQMVISLLNAQTEFLTHPSAIDAIKESRERMQAIAILHQKLYQLGNSTRVNIRSYVNELIDNIKNSFADSERIYFKLDVDDVGLDISQSVSLGLILNEAITNAVKYAYPQDKKGLIKVSLKHSGTDKLQLKIADNGKGMPAAINIDESNSLGLQLIKLFSEQLEGELYFFNNNGLEIILNFKTTGYRNLAPVAATA